MFFQAVNIFANHFEVADTNRLNQINQPLF